MHHRIMTIILLIAVILTGPLQADDLEEPVRFVVISDTQGITPTLPINQAAIKILIQRILLLDPPAQFVIVTGDLVVGSEDDDLTREQFDLWYEAFADLYESDMWNLKVYPLPGNHDMRADNAIQVWQEMFDYLPDNGPEDEKKGTYSFDAGPCHLVAVNTDAPDRRHKIDLDWLADDLAASDKPIKIVFGHEPAYPVDGHTGSSLDKFPELRDEFWQILIENGVQAYFCGHEHIHSHWIYDGVHHIINGGGGGPMIPLIKNSFFHYIVVDATSNDVYIEVVDLHDFTQEQFKLSDQEVTDIDMAGRPGDWLMSLLPCGMVVLVPLTCMGLLAAPLVAKRESSIGN